MDQAKKYIEIIASDFTEGQILTGKVVSIKDFGAFLEFAPGKEGLVHIAKADNVFYFLNTLFCELGDVYQTFESNGSTSQASICASTMSLMAAGVPIKKPVAGISCGLVTGETDDDYLVLTDIQGLEDFFGDMDFKVAGTHDGITAIQMDIKIHGLTRQIVEEAIARTKQAREYILTEVMEKAIAEPRKTVGEFAPKIIQMMIDPQKIGEVVGQRGKTINAIIDETGVKIDITDDGAVSICGTEQAMMDQAKKYIFAHADYFYNIAKADNVFYFLNTLFCELGDVYQTFFSRQVSVHPPCL